MCVCVCKGVCACEKVCTCVVGDMYVGDMYVGGEGGQGSVRA